MSYITGLDPAGNIYTNYSLVNTYLIHRCQMERKNSYLGLNSVYALSNHYLPVVFKMMVDLMKLNIREYNPSLESVDASQILIHDGVCKRLVQEKGGGVLLKSHVKQGFRYRHVHDPDRDDILRTHFIADGQYYSDRKRHKSLGEYHAFAQEMFGIDRCPPSFFSHKAVVVCTVKTIIEQLARHGLQHSFPFAIISRETEEYRNESLPLEPMILFSSNYDAVREYLKSSPGRGIDFLLVLGDSQISRNLSNIKLDHCQGLFGSYHLIGNNPIQRDNKMLIWNWTAKEEGLLLGRHCVSLRYHRIPVHERLADALGQYERLIRELRDEFGGIWFLRAINHVFRGILADKLNLERDFESAYGKRIRDDSGSGLLSCYLDTGDIEGVVEEVIPVLRNVFLEKLDGSDFLELISDNYDHIPCLVVPRRLVGIWRKTLENREMGETGVISFSEMIKGINKGANAGSFIFPYPIHYRHYEMLSRLSPGNPVEINLHLFEPELALVRSVVQKHETESRLIGGYKDERIYPQIDFGENLFPHREHTGDLLSRLEENIGLADEEDEYEFINEEDYSSIRILARTMDMEEVELNCHSRIIRLNEETRQLVPVTELTSGDKILYYKNQNRDLLYGIIAMESRSFVNVENDSVLWKTKLREYVGYREYDEFGSDSPDLTLHHTFDEDSLSSLAALLNGKPQYILDNWIKNTDRVKFPKKKTMNTLLNHLLGGGLITESEKKGILQSRALYNSVMISLGQNLSGEIQSILLNTTDSTMQNYIIDNVSNHVDEYPILSRFEADVIEFIIRANTEAYEFVSMDASISPA